MKRLLYALGLALSLSAGASAQPTIIGPSNAILCNKLATLAVGPVVITQIAAAVAGQVITICGWHITNTAATGTFALAYGTGSNCGTGTNTFVPAQNVTSTAPATDHIDYDIYSLPVATALCITPSVATIAGVVYYSQF